MIATKILTARKRKAWTQKQLSEHSGVTQPNIARYENGAIPSAGNLRKLAKALNVSIEYFHEHSSEKNVTAFDEVEFDRKLKQIKGLSAKRKQELSGMLDVILDLQSLEESFEKVK